MVPFSDDQYILCGCEGAGNLLVILTSSDSIVKDGNIESQLNIYDILPLTGSPNEYALAVHANGEGEDKAGLVFLKVERTS